MEQQVIFYIQRLNKDFWDNYLSKIYKIPGRKQSIKTEDANKIN